MTQKTQLQITLEQQTYLKAHADIEYQCYYQKIEEYYFWQHYLWNYLTAKYGIKPSLGIGDTDKSQNIVFEDEPSVSDQINDSEASQGFRDIFKNKDQVNAKGGVS